MNEEFTIEQDEELTPYIGMDADEAAADLHDKGISVRVKVVGSRWTADYKSDRVNLVADDNNKVTSVHYG